MSFFGRLYRGELGYDFVSRRQRWYRISAILLTICLLSIVFRGFNFGIEFVGGNSFQVSGTSQELDAASAAATDAGAAVSSAQLVGQGTILIKTGELNNDQSTAVIDGIAKAVGASPADVSNSAVSAQWGGDITSKALQALIVFLVAVMIFIAVRFQPKMAAGAMMALINDLLLSAGVYSIIGFEVTPSTVIGLLTILGFSLYDTVVVFDKVDENTRGILGGARTTYSQAANVAVNQTLMRSINTSLIALLPVAGLLFVGAGLLGAGTLKDLALVLFVGIATGTYSSIFLATPILCDLKEREPAYIALTKRVRAKQSSGRKTEELVTAGTPAKSRRGSAVQLRKTAPAAVLDADNADDSELTADLDVDDSPDRVDDAESAQPVVPTTKTPARAGAAKSGAKSGRPNAKPQARRSGGRPSGKRKR